MTYIHILSVKKGTLFVRLAPILSCDLVGRGSEVVKPETLAAGDHQVSRDMSKKTTAQKSKEYIVTVPSLSPLFR